MCKTDVYKAKCPKCKGAWQVKETVHPMCKEAAKAKPPQRGGSVCANEDVHSSPVVSHDVHAASRVADRALISWPVFSGLGNDDEREKKYLPLPTARAGTLNGQRATDESKEAAKREQVQSASNMPPPCNGLSKSRLAQLPVMPGTGRSTVGRGRWAAAGLDLTARQLGSCTAG
ncbi:hypothetical protein ACCO45_010601 [Purpureocillium lilacinum]|uniref:Uncharacterized protein n=1 Tax=Purpureocillium lilacinum TaxID=33203 RepID=A0ACC4DG98_PURLI